MSNKPTVSAEDFRVIWRNLGNIETTLIKSKDTDFEMEVFFELVDTLKKYIII